MGDHDAYVHHWLVKGYNMTNHDNCIGHFVTWVPGILGYSVCECRIGKGGSQISRDTSILDVMHHFVKRGSLGKMLD